MGKAANIDKVRYSHDGHDYHFLWSARQALRLLDPRSGLVAISIEGVSPLEQDDAVPLEGGLLVVDSTEYYGSERLETTNRVIYSQLKHSTTSPDTPWTAAQLTPLSTKDKQPTGTIKGFADRFVELRTVYGEEWVKEKIRFQFVTNRPIDSTVATVLAAVRAGRDTSLKSKAELKALERLRVSSGLVPEDFSAFVQLLDLQGGSGSRVALAQEVTAGANRLRPGLDTDVTIKLKSLIHSKALSDAHHDPVIRRETVLHAMGIANPEQLFPSPQNFESTNAAVRRIQEQEIASVVIVAREPVVIHAAGGVGKSVLATRLPELMPAGSAAVVFDGFAGGAYRSPRDPRHSHDRGLVQIANELALQGLCDPLLPLPDTPANYLGAFYRRLCQAVETVRQRSADALLLVVLDAADNSEIAAREVHVSSFARDLLQETPPDGCRLVALTRSERRNLLDIPPSVQAVELLPFTPPETAQHLRSVLPNTSEEEARDFHRLTGGNPRIQANELDAAQGDLPAALRRLGPSPKSIDDAIEEQLEAALRRVEELSGSKTQTSMLCTALAALPPRVPCKILAQAAGMPEAAVHSFAADLGRPLMLLDGAVQFRDEPVETWFRNRFGADDVAIARLANAIMPLAQSDEYAASALPRLLYAAGRIDELMEMALTGTAPDADDPVERREVVLRRVQFALKSALARNEPLGATKLLLRAAEEVSTHHRQTDFLIANADLIAILTGPEHVQDLLYREGLAHWIGAASAHNAAMLAPEPRYRVEAKSFLRQADSWVREWSQRPHEEHSEEKIRIKDIAAICYAALHLFGAEKAARCLRGWRPWSVSFDAGRIITSRLIESGRLETTLSFARAAMPNVCLFLAIALEMNQAGYTLPEDLLLKASKHLLRKRFDKEPEHSFRRSFVPVAIAIAAVAELLVRVHGPVPDALRLLDYYLPDLPEYAPRGPTAEDGDQRGQLLRVYTLRATLRGESLALWDLLPDKLKQRLDDGKGEYDETLREFRDTLGRLLPWYQIRAEVLAGRLDKQAVGEKLVAAAQKAGHDSWRLAQNWHAQDVLSNAAQVWLDVATLAGIKADDTARSIEGWLNHRDRSVGVHTWTVLCRRLSYTPDGAECCIRFADKANRILVDQHCSARSAADSYADLARAVLPVSREEASAYFQLGVDALDRIDDDARHRLETLFSLADTYGRAGAADPKAAYRLSRVTELIGREYDSHKFPWDDAIRNVSALCPSSGIAILSRWRDRATGWLGDMLFEVLDDLTEKGLISPGMALSLLVLGGGLRNWKLESFVYRLFEAEPDEGCRRTMLDLLVQDLELDRSERGAGATLLKVANHFAIEHERLGTYIYFKKDQANSEEPLDPPRLRKKPSTEKSEGPDWAAILGGASFSTPNEIDEAYRRFRQQDPPWHSEELLRRMRATLPRNRRTDHLQALVYAEELDTRDVLEAIAAAQQEWGNSAALRRILPKAAIQLFDHRIPELIGRWYSIRPHMRDISRLSGKSEMELLIPLLKYAADRIDSVSAESLYTLAACLGEHLDPKEAGDALRFGLDRFEPLLKADDGDGPWRDELAPPRDLSESVAGLLQAALAAPEAAWRWRAAHAVRRLVRFGEQATIAALIGGIKQTECPDFTDHRFPFYALHARLYLLIALARSVRENPSALAKHAGVFEQLALKDLPHVLIRKFAVETALALEEMIPGTYPAVVMRALREINQSPFPEQDEDYEPIMGSDGTTNRRERDIHFEIDFEPYWFDPLAVIFGLPVSHITQGVKRWIHKRWKEGAVWTWDDDPRARRGMFRDMSTSHSHGGYPRVDRHSFYLTYHAMFCVAGELIAEYPARKDRWEKDRIDYWIAGHSLTRSDGRWLSDRRDPAPLERRRWENEKPSDDWCWEVADVDFEEALGIQGATAQSVVVNGSWTVSEWDRSENIRIESALVTPYSAIALLRALQTDRNPHDYRLPPEGHELEITQPGFELKGWIIDPHTDRRLDEFDPLAGGIDYPGPYPGTLVRRLCRLASDEEHRVWTLCGNADGNVFRTEIWAEGKEEDRPSSSRYGKRMTMQIAFLPNLLSRVQRDLIIEVQIARRSRETKNHDYIPPYFRLYLLRSDGILHTLQAHRRLGQAIGS